MDTASTPMLYILMLLDAPDVPFRPEEAELHTQLQYQIGTPDPQAFPEARGLYYPAAAGPCARLHLVRFHRAWSAGSPLADELLRTTPEPLAAFARHYVLWLVATESVPVRMGDFAEQIRALDKDAWIGLMRDARFRHHHAADYVHDLMVNGYRRYRPYVNEEAMCAILCAIASGSNMHRVDTLDTLRRVDMLYTLIRKEEVVMCFPRTMHMLESGLQPAYRQTLSTTMYIALHRGVPLMRRRRLWARVRAVYYGVIMNSLYRRWKYHPDRLATAMSGLRLMTAATRSRMRDDTSTERPTALPAEFRILHIEAYFRVHM